MAEHTDPKKVLITGANGLIGSLLYTRLASQLGVYDPYGMDFHARPLPRVAALNLPAIPAEKLHVADLADFVAVQHAVEGMDVVIHLGADTNSSGAWESILSNNITGSYHVFEACRQAGVKRVVFASSNQVVFGYRTEEPYKSLFEGRFDDVSPQDIRPIQVTQATRTLNYYSASKAYGESLAQIYAYVHGLSCICLRFGWVTADDRLATPTARILFCSQRDVVQVIERSINAPDSLRFDVFFAHSDNLYNLVDIQHTKDVLGYVPQDHAEDRIGG